VIEAVRRSCENKARIVAADECEGGVRALLNFGHTFGHAMETATGYTRLLHGEAVAIGMALAARLSQRMGWIADQEVDGLRTLLQELGLPVDPPAGTIAADLIGHMALDKKVRAGAVRLVLLQRIGAAVLTADYPPALMHSVVEDACTMERAPA
jgi:3-dehydroquinate synthase